MIIRNYILRLILFAINFKKNVLKFDQTYLNIKMEPKKSIKPKKEKVECPEPIIVGGSKQTKNWRKKQEWYKTGKSNECEKYQIGLIYDITKQTKFEKTNDRLNMETLELKSVKYPLKEDDGFDWTENFDLKLVSDKTIYFNLKFVCSEGGSQTRSMREVYHFMKTQIKYLQVSSEKIYFINILDGDGAHKFMQKFSKLLSKHSKKIQRYIFVGDMLDFKEFYSKTFSKIN